MGKTKCDFALKASRTGEEKEEGETLANFSCKRLSAARISDCMEGKVCWQHSCGFQRLSPIVTRLIFSRRRFFSYFSFFLSLKSLKTTLNTRKPVKSIKQKARQLCIQDWERPENFSMLMNFCCFLCKTPLRLNLNFSSRSFTTNDDGIFKESDKKFVQRWNFLMH